MAWNSDSSGRFWFQYIKVFRVVIKFNEYQTWKFNGAVGGNKSLGVFLHLKNAFIQLLVVLLWSTHMPTSSAKSRFHISGNEDWQSKFPTTLHLIAGGQSPLISPFSSRNSKIQGKSILGAGWGSWRKGGSVLWKRITAEFLFPFDKPVTYTQDYFPPLKQDNAVALLIYSVHLKYYLKWNPDNTNVPLAIRPREQAVML